MRKKISNDKLKDALHAVSNLLENNKLPKKYNGYVASLGPAIIGSGLLPALAFYTNREKAKQEDNKTEKRRLELLKAIFKVANFQGYDGDLLNYALANQTRETKNTILEAIVAIKLAMRNFLHSETQNA